MSAVLQVRGLAKSFGRLQALRAIDLQADAGELIAVIGPNGAGKTTLLSIIAGAQRASAGTVEPGPRSVGWAPQETAIYSRLTVRENLELFARLESAPDVEATVEAMLAQTGLKARENERAGRLSGGNRQRLNLALALLSQPVVLALDEPSAELDPAQRARLWEFVCARARAGTTVLFSTHEVLEAQRYADRVLVLADGGVVFLGTPGELMAAGGEPEGGDFERALVAFLEEREAARPAGATG